MATKSITDIEYPVTPKKVLRRLLRCLDQWTDRPALPADLTALIDVANDFLCKTPENNHSTRTMRKPTLTREEILSVVSYNPTDGLFRWRYSGIRGPIRHNANDVVKPIKTGYVQIMIAGQRVQGHRLAWFLIYGKWPIEIIDHINRNRADNREGNLRECTQAQNATNNAGWKRTKSGLKGAFIMNDGRYQAAITRGGVRKYLGVFRTPEEAHDAYKKAAIEAFGEFARWD